MQKVICPYCKVKAKLVKGEQIYGSFNRAAKDNFWLCLLCGAYVSAHKENKEYGFDGTEPMGMLANRDLRQARIAVHKMFDELWTSGKWGRGKAYAWFSVRMGLPASECHIGMFDLGQCEKAQGVLQGIKGIFDIVPVQPKKEKALGWKKPNSFKKAKRRLRR